VAKAIALSCGIALLLGTAVLPGASAGMTFPSTSPLRIGDALAYIAQTWDQGEGGAPAPRIAFRLDAVSTVLSPDGKGVPTLFVTVGRGPWSTQNDAWVPSSTSALLFDLSAHRFYGSITDTAAGTQVAYERPSNASIECVLLWTLDGALGVPVADAGQPCLGPHQVISTDAWSPWNGPGPGPRDLVALGDTHGNLAWSDPSSHVVIQAASREGTMTSVEYLASASSGSGELLSSAVQDLQPPSTRAAVEMGSYGRDGPTDGAQLSFTLDAARAALQSSSMGQPFRDYVSAHPHAVLTQFTYGKAPTSTGFVASWKLWWSDPERAGFGARVDQEFLAANGISPAPRSPSASPLDAQETSAFVHRLGDADVAHHAITLDSMVHSAQERVPAAYSSGTVVGLWWSTFVHDAAGDRNNAATSWPDEAFDAWSASVTVAREDAPGDTITTYFDAGSGAARELASPTHAALSFSGPSAYASAPTFRADVPSYGSEPDYWKLVAPLSAVAILVVGAGFLLRRGALLALYNRLGPDRLLTQPVRRRILQELEGAGPLSLQELRARAGKSENTVRHHTRILVAHGLVRDEEWRGRRVYAASSKPIADLRSRLLLRSPAARKLLQTLRNRPEGSTMVELMADASVSKGAAYYHLLRMRNAGIIDITGKRGSMVFRARPQSRPLQGHSEKVEQTSG
jgi:predicted transcriptional regulator